MKVDDVVSELVVLRLNGLEVLAKHLVIPHLLFELLDVALLPLSESSLKCESADVISQDRRLHTCAALF